MQKMTKMLYMSTCGDEEGMSAKSMRPSKLFAAAADLRNLVMWACGAAVKECDVTFRWRTLP